MKIFIKKMYSKKILTYREFKTANILINLQLLLIIEI